MRYAGCHELSQFHDAFLAMCEKHAAAKQQREWGFPNGVILCDTFSFNTRQGTLYVGHHDIGQGKRWWIPIRLEDQAADGQLQIDFELCIPKGTDMRLSVHYVIDIDNAVHIMHKGRFTVGRRGLRMSAFFASYRKNPGRWQLMEFRDHTYLVLGRVNLAMTDTDFTALLGSMADFARYIPKFKDAFRQSGRNRASG